MEEEKKARKEGNGKDGANRIVNGKLKKNAHILEAGSWESKSCKRTSRKK